MKRLMIKGLIISSLFASSVTAVALPPFPFLTPIQTQHQEIPLKGQVVCISPVLRLDNKTCADIDDILDDPFLSLRQKLCSGSIEDSDATAWEYTAELLTSEAFPEASLDIELSSLGDISGSAPYYVANHDLVFDHIKPIFELAGEQGHVEELFWQILRKGTSGKPLQQVFEWKGTYSPIVEFNELQATFLNANEDYIFRFSLKQNGVWGPLSEPFIFKAIKPASIQKITFDKVREDTWEIAWASSANSDVKYAVFASNSIDFIPSIYFDKQVTEAYQGNIVNFKPSNNLVTTTNKNRIQIDGSYAYYRIVAIEKGCVSVPSEIIYVYDKDLHFERDTLNYDKELGLVTRVAIPLHGRVAQPSLPSKTWTKGGFVSEKDWLKVLPYLIPENHPMLSRLDRIFKNSRASQDADHMREAGFAKPSPLGPSRPVVTRHPLLKGFLLKLYLDTQVGINEVNRLSRRVAGALSCEEAVKRLGYEHIFRIPKKWLYPLPDSPSPKRGLDRKNFVLIVQDMNILPSIRNRQKWKSSAATKEILNALYVLFEDQGLADSVFAFNVPFDRDGYIAIIDTEIFHVWPVPFEKYLKWLDHNGQKHWKFLMKNGGP